jgi:predicted helicase
LPSFNYIANLAILAHKAYSSLSNEIDIIDGYLEKTTELWNINSKLQDPLDIFIQICIILAFQHYSKKKDISGFITPTKRFDISYQPILLINEPIPISIYKYFIDPLIKELNSWNNDEKQKIDSYQFYGQFLQKYRKHEAKKYGSVYTPLEIIDFIVDAIHYLLIQEFRIKDGLKSTAIPIKVVDPAAGVLNFPMRLRKYYNNESFINSVLTMEIGIIPYLIGLHNASKLTNFPNTHHFFNRNSLFEDSFNIMNNFLDEDISIVLGNPPYYINTQNNNPWIKGELTEYKKKLKEKNLKILSDDYVKFLRISHKLFQQKKREGIIAFITNNNYIDGSVFKAMRKSLTQTFSKIYIVNLHGNYRKNETGNPFNIKVGVSIIFLIKTSDNHQSEENFNVFYWDVPQSELKDKYSQLSKGFHPKKFTKVEKTPDFFFIPRVIKSELQYLQFIPINKIFITKPKSGIMTGRDSLVSNPDKEILFENLSLFFHKRYEKMDLLNIRAKKTKTWDPKKAMSKSSYNLALKSITPYYYRGFIRDYLVYDPNLLDGCRMGYLDKISPTNPAICVTRSIRTDHFSHALVVDYPPEKCLLGIKDSSYVFLLKLPKNSEEYNIAIPDLKYAVTHEQVFFYIYAILHCPIYRQQYNEQLKRHLPHIPFPLKKNLFEKMTSYGKLLTETHLDKELKDPERYTINNGSNLTIDNYYYNQNTQSIHFGTLETSLVISNISLDTWNFEIGSIKQLEYWLKSRKTYKSPTRKKRHIGLLRPINKDELHEFLNLCTKIQTTINLLPKIDEVYKEIIAEIFKQSET